MVPWKRLGDLARDPLCSRVCRHAKRHPNTSSVPYDDKTIEDLERDRWQDKEINRCDVIGMVAEKRPPALRWWPPTAAHILSDRHWATSKPSLSNSPWMCGAPQSASRGSFRQ